MDWVFKNWFREWLSYDESITEKMLKDSFYGKSDTLNVVIEYDK